MGHSMAACEPVQRPVLVPVLQTHVQEPHDGSSKFDVHTVQKQVETFYIGDDLPEPPEAPPAAEDSMSSFACFEDDLLPEPPEAPPELQVRSGLAVLAGPGHKALDKTVEVARIFDAKFTGTRTDVSAGAGDDDQGVSKPGA